MNCGLHPTRPPLFVSLRLFAVAAFALASIIGRAQMIDLNSNGVSDVWEWTYKAYGIDPNIDSDGDGYLNWQEAIAGTSPFDSNSYPRISSASNSPGGFSATFRSAPGNSLSARRIAPG